MFSRRWIEVFIILFSVNFIGAQDVSITIPLNKSLSLWNTELYGDFYKVNALSSLQVNFSDINKNVTFIIFQVHSYLYNVTLSNSTVMSKSIKGTNLGMYSPVKNIDTFTIYNDNKGYNVSLYITVHGYSALDPIPGGCNLEFPLPISPYLMTKENKDYLYVDAPPPKHINDTKCHSLLPESITFYRLYLPERDFTEFSYFDGLKRMLTLDKIMENGVIIPDNPSSLWSTRRVLSAYPGTGSVYVAVTSGKLGYSVYTPVITYLCDPVTGDRCRGTDNILTKMACTLIFTIGLLTCYFGHKFFKTEMFLTGLASGAIITYIVIGLSAPLDSSVLLGAALLSGVFFGAIWSLFWWFYGIPVIAVLLSVLNLGFMVAAIAYYCIPGGILILEEDLNFWTLYIFIILLTAVSLLSMAYLSNILCCAVLGGYAVIFPVDYYLGSNLHYILINVTRRALVKNFNFAIVAPPWGLNDLLLTLTWVTLAFTGVLFQHYHNRGRAPFPPPPRAIRRSPPPEQRSYYGAVHHHHHHSHVVLATNPVIISNPSVSITDLVVEDHIVTNQQFDYDETSPLISYPALPTTAPVAEDHIVVTNQQFDYNETSPLIR